MLYLVLLAVVVGYLALERALHQRRLLQIPLRIHINGTRGKTSVTRLTAQLLRRAGIRTLAKTTGDYPELIWVDGRATRLKRRGSARIQEQLVFLTEAARQKAHAVVVECMALNDHLQQVSERLMVQSTIGVITNVRPDHYEVMGHSLDQVAKSLSQTIPPGAVLVTESGPWESMLRERCLAVGTRLDSVPATDSSGPTLRDSSRLMEENRAFVRAIGLQAGLTPETVDRTLKEMAADETTSLLFQMGSGSRRMALIDAFSANDTVSAARVQAEWLASNEAVLPRPFVALLNARADRPLRTLAFIQFIADQPGFDAIGLTGDGRWLARRRLRQLSLSAPMFTLAPRAPAQLLEDVARQTGSSSFTLVGLGNHRGAGEALRGYFMEGRLCC
jgi:gamma-polyglutamate synthase